MNVAIAFSDDTNSLVDDALSRVRREACLDAEPVLSTDLLRPKKRAVPPPLPKSFPKADSTFILVPTPVPLPSAEVIAADAVKKNAPTVVVPRPELRDARRGVRWPVIVCGLVASIFAGAAFMRSPIGQKPAVQHIVKVAKSHSASAYQAAKHATARF